MKSFNTESKDDSEDDQRSKNDLGALQGDYDHIVSGEATSGLINDGRSAFKTLFNDYENIFKEPGATGIRNHIWLLALLFYIGMAWLVRHAPFPDGEKNSEVAHISSVVDKMIAHNPGDSNIGKDIKPMSAANKPSDNLRKRPLKHDSRKPNYSNHKNSDDMAHVQMRSIENQYKAILKPALESPDCPDSNLIVFSTFLSAPDNQTISNIRCLIETEDDKNIEECGVFLHSASGNTTSFTPISYNINKNSLSNRAELDNLVNRKIDSVTIKQYYCSGTIKNDHYTVTPLKDDDPRKGISTRDISLIKKHLAGTDLLNSPYKLIAADVDKSGSITKVDIEILRKLVLGIYREIPYNTSWRFVDRDYVFPDPLNPFLEHFPENKTIAIPHTAPHIGFTGIKTGDIDGDAISLNKGTNNDRNNNKRDAYVFKLSCHNAYNDSAFSTTAIKPNDIFTVRFKGSARTSGYQFTLNHTGLELLEIIPGASMDADNFGIFGQEQSFTHSWDGDGVPEFILKFKAKTPGIPSQMIRLSDSITPVEAYPHENGDKTKVFLEFERSGAPGPGTTGQKE
jgi:Dockerin type I domain